jgi:hypothetical protein
MRQSAEESIRLDASGLGMPAAIGVFGRAAQTVYPCCRPLLSGLMMHNFYAIGPYDI